MHTIPVYTNPKLQDSIVQSLNALITEHVEYLYGIASMGYDEDGSTYPSIYWNDGSGKNMMLFPDDKVKSFGFWEFFDGAEVLNDDDGTYFRLAFVFWGNLERIDSTKNYDFTSEILQAILNIFIEQGAEEVSYTIGDVFSIYSKYLEEAKQTLMKPNTGFKIELRMHDIPCMDTFRRETESGGTRVTEDGDIRILE